MEKGLLSASQTNKMDKQKTLSVCIPTYEIDSMGHTFLKHSFDVLMTQTFKDFDVVISDHSKTDLFKKAISLFCNYEVLKYPYGYWIKERFQQNF